MKKLIENKSILIVLILLIIISCQQKPEITAPTKLTISEGLVNPIGFYDNEPTFSWILPKGVKYQAAYSIVVASSPDLLPYNADLWESGKIISDKSIFIKYQGEKLVSRQKVYWQVMYWEQGGKTSYWSDIAHFELGLLNNNNWKAKWISFPKVLLTEYDNHKSILFRPQYMRKEINIPSKIQAARLYITAKGVYEAYINGKKVGADVMSPGWTPNHSISTITYDVTNVLKEGDNTLGAIVAEGWRSGRINLRKTKKTEIHTPSLLYQLEIQMQDGSKTIISDNSWKVTNRGPIRIAKIYDGETYDANYDLGGWSINGYDDTQWHTAQQSFIEDSISLMPKRYQGVRDKELLRVQEITEPQKGKPIFNFGQNNVGVPLIKVPMKKGDTLTIRFAEMLNTNGKMYTDNYRSAKSTDYYIAAKDGVTEWRPTFTFHGYQYVELSGYNSNFKPQKDWVKAIVQYSDFSKNGNFTSSHPKLNKLQSNITWGLRSNFFDIPTDCPQRDERLGWTGDAQVIVPTALYNANMYAFWSGYLQSVRQEQMGNGGIPHVIPNVLGTKSSSGWGDACVIIPWELYFRTGDKGVLEDNYETMKKWIGFYKSKVRNNDFIPRNTAFRDWLQPYSTPQKNFKMTRRGDTPENLINTAYFARSVELTQRSAKVLGMPEEAETLKILLDSIKVAFEKMFFDANGLVKSKIETQTAYLLALEFNLLSDELKTKAIENLKRVIGECDGHLRTGFLGTPILPLVLDKAGEIDLMYSILFKETYPSWFYSINNGATTMWERWDSFTIEKGFHKDGMNSFNHYAYGAIGQWMYERIAGIKAIEAGYKKIEISPIPGGALTSAKASYQSPYGKISSDWMVAGNNFTLKVEIPSNTIAKIIIPGNVKKKLLLEGKEFKNNLSIKQFNTSKNGFELLAKPGSYSFSTKIK